jgi:hypothetical protein
MKVIRITECREKKPYRGEGRRHWAKGRKQKAESRRLVKLKVEKLKAVSKRQ